MNLNCERESYVHETPDANHFLSDDSSTFLSIDSTSPEEKLNNLRLKDLNRLIYADLKIISVKKWVRFIIKKKYQHLNGLRNKT